MSLNFFFQCFILLACNQSPTLSYDEIVALSKKTTKETLESEKHKIAEQNLLDIESQFSELAEEQNKQNLENTQQIATQSSQIESQFLELTQKQNETIIENTQKIASQTAQQTAQTVAQSTATNVAQEVASQKSQQAIANMEQQILELASATNKQLTENSKQIAIQTAQQTAQTVAQSTATIVAQEVAKKAIEQALSETQKTFSALSQEHIQNITEITLPIAEEIATKIATAKAEESSQNILAPAIEKALLDLESKFSEFSELQVRVIKVATLEIASQMAENTAREVANKQAQEALLDIETKFSKLSEEQNKQNLENTQKMATQTAQLENRFLELTQEQNKTITENSTQIATQTAQTVAQSTAESIAQEVANKTSQQALANTEQELAVLKEETTQFIANKIQSLQASTLEIAESTAREVADNSLETLVQQTSFKFTEQAIRDMKAKNSKILTEGLQNMLSVVLSSMVSSAFNNVEMNKEDQKKFLDDIKLSTVAVVAKASKQLKEEQIGSYNGAPLNLFFEQCTWQNQEYTARIVKDHDFFPLSDPLQKIINNWDTLDPSLNSPCPENSGDTNSESSCLAEESAPVKSSMAESSPSVSDTVFDETTNSLDTAEPDLFEEIPQTEDKSQSPLYDEMLLLSFFQESIIQDSQFFADDIPAECFFAGAVRGANIYDPGKNFYYCPQDSNQQSTYMPVTDENEQQRNILARRACLNKDYIYLTAKAFNKTANCFGFNKLEKESLFKLLNHESTFLHNIKSPTGAKCYGQLTKIALEEINKQIYFSGTNNPLPYSYIFEDVIEKCPGLQQVILDPKLYEPPETGVKSLGKFEKIIAQSPASCKITQNPYSCLFYSFYNFKKSFDLIEKQLYETTSNYSEERNLPLKFIDYFLLPINLNSMLSVTSPTGRKLLFWDDSEVWNSLRNSDWKAFTNIELAPLFQDDEEIRRLFSIWSYNGGISIARTYMSRFIKQLKRSLAQACPKDSQTKYCQYRFMVIEGQGIPTINIIEDFKNYIKNNYQTGTNISPSRRNEVAGFTNHIEKNLNYLYDKNGLFRVHLKNMVPELDNQDIEKFQDYLTEICPSPFSF